MLPWLIVSYLKSLSCAKVRDGKLYVYEELFTIEEVWMNCLLIGSQVHQQSCASPSLQRTNMQLRGTNLTQERSYRGNVTYSLPGYVCHYICFLYSYKNKQHNPKKRGTGTDRGGLDRKNRNVTSLHGYNNPIFPVFIPLLLLLKVILSQSHHSYLFSNNNSKEETRSQISHSLFKHIHIP